MRKLLKIAGIIVGILILLLIGLSILVKSYLSSERLKPILLPRAEAMTGRKVQLDKIDVSLFKGVILKGLTVKERDGKEDFLKMGQFVLSYRLLPLLRRQLVISKIEIISPFIAIEKEKGGKYNFSDLMTGGSREAQKPRTPSGPGHQTLPIWVIADSLVVKNGQLSFVDKGKELPDIVAKFDADFKGSLERDGTPRLESGRITINDIKATVKNAAVNGSGKVDLDPKDMRANLQGRVGKDTVEISAVIKDYRSGPNVLADVHAKTLDFQRLMALGGGGSQEKGSSQEKAHDPPPQVMKTEPSGAGERAPSIRASGNITIDEGKYTDYTLNNIRAHYQYGKGVMTMDPIGLQFSGGESIRTEGSLNGNLQFSGESASAIRKTLKGKAVAKLGKGTAKESQVFEAIAVLTGIPALKNPSFDDGLFHLDLKEERIFLDGWIRSALFQMIPKGTVDFEKRLDLPTELKLSPTLIGKMKGNLAALKFLEDAQGWKTLPLRIRGTTENPSVSLDENVLGKQLGRGLMNELERRLLEKKQKTPEKGSGGSKSKDLLKQLLGE